MKKNYSFCVLALFLLLFVNQSVLSQYPISPDKSARDDTENITADDLKKTHNIFSHPELGIKKLLEPTATFINFDDIIIYVENSVIIQPNRYAGVSFYSTPLTATWLSRYQSYSYPNSLIVGTNSGYPYYEIYSADNINIDFAQPAKDVAFIWGRNGFYNPGQIQIYDNNNQLVATVPVNFGGYTWVSLSLNQYSQRIKKLVLRRPPVPDGRYGHIHLDNFQFQPNPFVAPVGSLSSVSTTAPAGAVGWSVDPDNASASNNVDCYVDGIVGQGRFIGRVLANNPSPPGVPYSGNHGFFTAIPTDLRDGNQHQMYCYGIDVLGGSPPTLLTGSPKAFTWNLDSTVEFSNLPSVVEAFGEGTLNVTVRNLPNPNDTTRLTFRTTNGTGVAKFINNSNQYVDELVITGNVTNQAVRIRGITESSQANNLVIEARFGNSTTVKATQIFTVVTITSLVFERFDTSYTDLSMNPGNGQIYSNIGQRIFPDKIDSADQTDRSLVKVKATISPAMPNVKIYFANFDMDDPSANAAPIDTNGIAGNDNNGSVMVGGTTSPAGQLSIIGAPIIGCSAIVGNAECITGSDGTLTLQFKTTMQPGDNFAIVATLNDIYRNGLQIYATSIFNNEGGVLHVSGEFNEDVCAGVVTQLLTIWRRLHIEVDSMGAVQNNFVQGTIPDSVKIRPNQTTTITVSPTPNIPLEVNRFEGGRLFVNGSSLTVTCDLTMGIDCNTGNTVRVQNTGFTTITIPPNASFTLYDDDDMDNEDGENFNGDEGDDVQTLPRTYLEDSDNPTLNHLVPAYIIPKYDIGDNNNSVPFVLNVSAPLNSAVIALYDLDHNATEDSSFWTQYILSGYQYTTSRDEDPESEAPNTIFGASDSEFNIGSIVFMETNGIKECSFPLVDYQDIVCDINATKIHEIGHTLGADHLEGGVMDDESLLFSDISLRAIRVKIH